MRHVLGGNPGPVIGKADFRILSRLGLNQISPHIVFRQADLPQTDFYPAAAAQRIAGIKAQIQYQALQMFRIYCRRQILRVEISDNFHFPADAVTEQIKAFFQTRGQIDRRRLFRTARRQSRHLPRQMRSLLATAQNSVAVTAFLIAFQAFFQTLRRAADAGKHVIKIMSRAAGHSCRGFHPAGLFKLFFQHSAFRSDFPVLFPHNRKQSAKQNQPRGQHNQKQVFHSHIPA